MTYKQKQQLLEDCIFAFNNDEFDGKFENDRDNRLSDNTDGYHGLVLHVADNGNVTLYKQFKNGNRREIANRV